jgi:hypothetical protein
LNGDGYPGPGPSFDRFNDLVYVPNTATELPSSVGTWQVLGNALENDQCLREHQGQILLRNACRAPWQSRLDLRTAHRIRVAGTEIRLEADVINVLNALNSDWGRIQAIQPIVTLLEPIGRTTALNSRWSGGVLPSEAGDGKLTATDPWTPMTPDSQWQLQFGARITLDQGRRGFN